MSYQPWAQALRVLDGITPYRVSAGGYHDTLDIELGTCADYQLVCERLGITPSEAITMWSSGIVAWQTRHAHGWVSHHHPIDRPCPTKALDQEAAA